MPLMLLLLTSIAAFASTNIDDIFLLMLFFGDRKYRPRQVVGGQYLGFVSLVAVSLLGSLLGILVDTLYIGLLGLLPVYLGIKELWELSRKGNEEGPSEKLSTTNRFHSPVLSVALVTFANGGDNIGIYVPLFAPLDWAERLWVIMIFLLMVALWCLIARYLSRHPVAARAMDRYGHIVAPIILVLLGAYILYESRAYTLFW